jgi:hypothetical protein
VSYAEARAEARFASRAAGKGTMLIPFLQSKISVDVDAHWSQSQYRSTRRGGIRM